MSVRSAVYQNSKVAKQATKGTAATPDVILNGLGWTRFKPVQRGGEMHTSSGNQFPDASVPSRKSHSESECGGKMMFNNMIRPLETLFGSVTANADGTNGKKRDFAMGNLTSIVRQYLTVEIGDSGRAKKVVDWFGKGLTLTFSDEKSEFKIPGLGGARQDDVTPTSSASGVAPSIINPGSYDVFLATTAAGLDTAEGTRQVETATVVGTIGASGAGNATVVVTSAAVTGSPITLQVAVANNDTASQVAAKIITALKANSAIAAAFAIGGSGANIVLTALVEAANDSSLNVSIDNGTCTGLTTAASSANTTAGVAGTKFPLPFMCELNIPDVVGQVYRMNSADTGPVDNANLPANPTFKFKTGDDDDDYATVIPYIASGGTLFWRIRAWGALIDGASVSRERFALDIATKIIVGEEPDEDQGAASNTFNLQLVQDATWTKMFNLQIINSVATISGA